MTQREYKMIASEDNLIKGFSTWQDIEDNKRIYRPIKLVKDDGRKRPEPKNALHKLTPSYRRELREYEAYREEVERSEKITNDLLGALDYAIANIRLSINDLKEKHYKLDDIHHVSLHELYDLLGYCEYMGVEIPPEKKAEIFTLFMDAFTNANQYDRKHFSNYLNNGNGVAYVHDATHYFPKLIQYWGLPITIEDFNICKQFVMETQGERRFPKDNPSRWFFNSNAWDILSTTDAKKAWKEKFGVNIDLSYLENNNKSSMDDFSM